MKSNIATKITSETSDPLKDLVKEYGDLKVKSKMKTQLYIVTAYRWGHHANHSYNLGVFDNQEQAIKCAESHTAYRGGKYACAVEEVSLNQYDEDADNYTNEIFKTKSLLCK